MSERYTPHDFRKASLAVFAAVEEAVAKELAAMLHQAATDAEQAEYQRRLTASMEELLRSAHCIAARRGEGTHWDRFAASIQALGIGPVTARTYRVLPSDTEDNLPMADTEPNGVDVWLIKWAISNCHTLARRRIKAGSTDSDWWGHVLRLCEKAGAKSLGVLRVGECDALGQAATDAEALAAKDAELRKRSDVTTAQTIALTELGEEVVSQFNRAESLQVALTAQRQKIREFRTWVEMRSGEDWVESADLVLTKLDALALGLTGDATEGQG